LLNYLGTVCGIFDAPGNNLDQLAALASQTRGANLLHRVLSGNIIDRFEVFPESVGQSGGLGAGSQKTKQTENSVGAGSEEEPEDELVVESKGQVTVELTSSQRCLNYLCNYLNVICVQEDALSGETLLKRSALFFSSQLFSVEHTLNRNRLEQKFNMKHSLNNVINVYLVQQNPVEQYL
jgi:hypothetical protein